VGYGVYGQASGSGTTNYGGYFAGGGGTNNYGVVVPNAGGYSGFGNNAPTTLVQIGNGNSGKLSIYTNDNSDGQFQIGNPQGNSEASMSFISGASVFGAAATSINGNDHIWTVGLGSWGNSGNTFVIGNGALAGPAITIFPTGLTGIGTNNPGRELEIGGNANTIRIDGIKAGSTFYSTVTAPTAASSVMFTNNTTGDVQALAPSATNGQVLTQTGGGIAWQAMGALNNVVVLSGSGTYTPAAGTKSLLVELVGGGGGGGGAKSNGSNNCSALAGGGGAGGYCKGWVANVAANYAYSVGGGGAAGANTPTNGSAGGTTTFGAFSATGGSGGTDATTNTNVANGGTGGAGSGGFINSTGNTGGTGTSYSGSAGAGGATIFGGVGPIVTSVPNNAVGNSPAANTGSGGGGAAADYCNNSSTQSAAGGAGAAGTIIVYEYK
jgi:hypothetical protein